MLGNNSFLLLRLLLLLRSSAFYSVLETYVSCWRLSANTSECIDIQCSHDFNCPIATVDCRQSVEPLGDRVGWTWFNTGFSYK